MGITETVNGVYYRDKSGNLIDAPVKILSTALIGDSISSTSGVSVNYNNNISTCLPYFSDDFLSRANQFSFTLDGRIADLLSKVDNYDYFVEQLGKLCNQEKDIAESDELNSFLDGVQIATGDQ